MKNSDMPAMPTIYADLAPNGAKELYCSDLGLTKREMFAMHAMQGLLSSEHEGYQYESPSQCANAAVKLAGALLEELDK